MGKGGDVKYLSGMRVEVKALAIYFTRGSGHLFPQRQECECSQDTFKAGAIEVLAMEFCLRHVRGSGHRVRRRREVDMAEEELQITQKRSNHIESDSRKLSWARV